MRVARLPRSVEAQSSDNASTFATPRADDSERFALTAIGYVYGYGYGDDSGDGYDERGETDPQCVERRIASLVPSQAAQCSAVKRANTAEKAKHSSARMPPSS